MFLLFFLQHRKKGKQKVLYGEKSLFSFETYVYRYKHKQVQVSQFIKYDKQGSVGQFEQSKDITFGFPLLLALSQVRSSVCKHCFMMCWILSLRAALPFMLNWLDKGNKLRNTFERTYCYDATTRNEMYCGFKVTLTHSSCKSHIKNTLSQLDNRFRVESKESKDNFKNKLILENDFIWNLRFNQRYLR